MIKCNVTIVGRVFRAPEIKNDRDGKPFVTFGLSTELKDNQETCDIDISVACDGEDDVVLGLSYGDRVKVKGVLTLKRREDVIYYNLSAEKVSPAPKAEDSISGQIQFRGTLGSKDIIEKEGKKGGFRIFDAYSAEKVGEDEFAYIWVHFIDFTENRPAWLVPRAAIKAEGKLEFALFNGRATISCRVSSLSRWDKETAKQ